MLDDHDPFDEERLASQMDRIDQQIVGESDPSEDDDHPPSDAHLDLAKRVLQLIHRIRSRDADIDAERSELGSGSEGETIASDQSDPRVADVAAPTRQQIGGYQILDQIARGGMGVVFRARDLSLNRIVALKMIIAGPFAVQQERARFRIEAEAAAALDHPGIVPVYEVGEHDGQPYFTMGLVEGESLAERIATEPLPPQTAAEVARQVASAVAYAHQRGVIHRDIKPANVLVDREGRPRITDFGLARRTDSVSDLTGTEQVLGTPSYMAPEQASGGANSAGEAADVYSIGATLYCMLTGRPPLQAATAAETLRLVLDTEPVAPKQLNPAIPNDLNTICLKCLRKEPHHRYASATALEADLSRFIHQEPILARPVGAIERTWKWSRRHPLVAGLSTAVVLATVALISGGIWYQSRLSRTLHEVRESRSAAVDSLYQSLTSEAEFLGQMRPLGYGPRVERLIDEAGSLDTAAKDPYQLRQSLVSSLGFVGAREPVDLEKVGAEITAAEVLPDRTHVIAGLRTGELVLFDLATGRKLAEHDCLSLPAARIDVDPAGKGGEGIQLRVLGQGGRELAVWSWDGSKGLAHVHTTHLEYPKSFYGIQTALESNRVLGVSPATADLARPDAWICPATRLLGADVAQPRRRDRGGLSFAVASLEHPDHPPRLLPVSATPRFDRNKDLLVVGHSWLDDTEVDDDDLQVFDLTTGRLVQSWNVSAGALRNVMISESGRHVACAGGFGVEVFHLGADHRIGKYDGLGPCSIESMPGDEGDVLVRTERETIWFSHRQNEPIARFAHRDDDSCMRLSSDERYAIWLGSDQARVVDLRGQERLRIPAHDRIAKTVSFSPDGRLLLSTGRFYGGNLTRVWNTSTGRLLFEFVGSASTFSPDGRWIACWSDDVKLWDVASGQLVARGQCPDTPSRIIFSDNGNALAACGHFPGQSRLWRIAASKSASARERELALERIEFGSQAQMPLALSPSGERLAFRRGDSLCVLHLADEEPFPHGRFSERPAEGLCRLSR